MRTMRMRIVFYRVNSQLVSCMDSSCIYIQQHINTHFDTLHLVSTKRHKKTRLTRIEIIFSCIEHNKLMNMGAHELTKLQVLMLIVKYISIMLMFFSRMYISPNSFERAINQPGSLVLKWISCIRIY